jgi:hypothetical protein
VISFLYCFIWLGINDQSHRTRYQRYQLVQLSQLENDL